MRSFLFCFLLFLLMFVAGCQSSFFDHTPRQLTYEVAVEPDMERVRISGTVDHLSKGVYYFALPRTQGFPPAHFVKYVQFQDDLGELEVEHTPEGEWKIDTRSSRVSFSYHINLQQAMKYQGEAWGGATTLLDDKSAFLNGSLSFMVPLIGNIAAPVSMKWSVPEGWNVVTPWTAATDSLSVPSHYALVNNYYIAYKDGSMFRQRVRDVELNTVWLGQGDINDLPGAATSIRKVVEAGLDFFGEESSKEGITLILRDSNSQNRFRASTEANSIEFNFKKGMSFERIWRDHQDGFLRLLAHEIMHTWDRREVQEATAYLHIREWGDDTCWLREGFTEYFAMLNLYKAGILELSAFVNTMQAISEAAQASNNAGAYSLTTACGSFFEDDQALSFIYTGGAALAFYLDLELRAATKGAKTLPAFMRTYMNEYRYKEKTINSFVEAWQAYTPPALHILNASVLSSQSIDPTTSLKELGLEQRRSNRGRRMAWFIPPSSALRFYFN